MFWSCFFFSFTASSDIYTLSLHDALPILVSWIKHSVDRFVIVSIFIPKLRLILILNSFLGSSDSLVFSELFHSLAPRPLAARSISDFLLTYLATRSEERFSRNAETDLVCRLLLEKKKNRLRSHPKPSESRKWAMSSFQSTSVLCSSAASTTATRP